ncbi:hypothetical protein DVH24_039421 [Malus domestica]|uniref:Uncharacterized protein n=1 Tax=Malus domestica TaxID=3750 RepID=A0A498I0F1_MALDO|nr:hypothetical protein DVH24_039421 [Malus domestica]
MEPEVSELPKGLVLGRDENIHLRLRGSTPLGDVARQAEPESSKTAGCKKTRRGTRRKAASQKAEAEKHKESSKATRTTRTTKRVKKSEPQYLEDPRNLQDLWKAAFPVGTNNVYLFGCTERKLTCLLSHAHLLCSVFFIPLSFNSETRIVFFAAQLVSVNGENKVVCIRGGRGQASVLTFVCQCLDIIVHFELSTETAKLIDLNHKYLFWAALREGAIALFHSPFLSVLLFIVLYVFRFCNQCYVTAISFYYLFVPYSTIYGFMAILYLCYFKAALKHMKIERLKKLEYCLPYFYQLFKEDELEQSTEVPIMFPGEPKPVRVYCEFDWELDELEEFTDNLIEEEELSADQKDEFKARETRRKAIEEMSEEAKTAFENMRFYKFYPVHTPDTPDISIVKVTSQTLIFWIYIGM